MRSDGSCHREREPQLTRAQLRLDDAADRLRDGRERLVAGEGDPAAYRLLFDRYRRAHQAVQRARRLPIGLPIEDGQRQAAAVTGST
jgi:hypothetical protein